MSDIKNLLDIVEEFSEEEGLVEAQDSFDIELGEDLLIETGVVDITEDGILVEGDEETLALLEQHGITFEDTDWSKYDEPTINRIKKGVTKPVDRTDYNVPPAMRDPMQGKPGYEKRRSRIMKGLEKVDEKMVMGLPGDQGSKVMGEDEVDEAKYQGREVPLGKPMAGDVKKSKVYVRKPNGKVVKVNFGDKKMRIKKSNPKRRKSFRARHNCKNPGPRWKARYWSCRAW
jgi:hypothetical protein